MVRSYLTATASDLFNVVFPNQKVIVIEHNKNRDGTKDWLVFHREQEDGYDDEYSDRLIPFREL